MRAVRTMTIVGPDGRVSLFYRGPGHTPEDVARFAHLRWFPDSLPWEVQVRDPLGDSLYPTAVANAGHKWERAGALHVRLLPRHNW
jgi:hypothetical protein